MQGCFGQHGRRNDRGEHAEQDATVFELLKFSPRLQKDFPMDAEKPTVRWIEK